MAIKRVPVFLKPAPQRGDRFRKPAQLVSSTDDTAHLKPSTEYKAPKVTEHERQVREAAKQPEPEFRHHIVGGRSGGHSSGKHYGR